MNDETDDDDPAWIMQNPTPLGAISVAARTPERLLPRLVDAAAKRNVSAAAVKTLIQITTPDALATALGRKEAGRIMKRYL